MACSTAIDDRLTEAVAATLSRHPAAVRRWCANEPGAWGFLAGQGVLAYRDRLGRRLTDAERRRVWAVVWAALERSRGGLP
jgi:hypothetical protein